MEAMYEDEMLPPTTEELLGENLDWLSCEEKTFELRGLKINSFKYISKIVGATRHPIFAVHGGPGFTHSYIKPLFLLCSSGYPVIFYDQAGCGKSTFIEDPAIEAPWLLTISYYLEELNSLISLYAAEKYYLYGSSWGKFIFKKVIYIFTHNLIFLSRHYSSSRICDKTTYWFVRNYTRFPFMRS